MAFHPISVETGTGQKANGAGSRLWGGVGEPTELLLGPSYPPGTCWPVSVAYPGSFQQGLWKESGAEDLGTLSSPSKS